MEIGGELNEVSVGVVREVFVFRFVSCRGGVGGGMGVWSSNEQFAGEVWV